jgi:hypothetical protein
MYYDVTSKLLDAVGLRYVKTADVLLGEIFAHKLNNDLVP